MEEKERKRKEEEEREFLWSNDLDLDEDVDLEDDMMNERDGVPMIDENGEVIDLDSDDDEIDGTAVDMKMVETIQWLIEDVKPKILETLGMTDENDTLTFDHWYEIAEYGYLEGIVEYGENATWEKMAELAFTKAFEMYTKQDES